MDAGLKLQSTGGTVKGLYEEAGIASVSMDELGAAIKGMLANAAAAWAFSQLLHLLIELATESDNFRKKAAELGSELTSTQSDLSDYNTKITELRDKITDSSTSIADSKKAREELLAIQDEMIAKYGDEAGAVKLITEAVDGSTDALDKLCEVGSIRPNGVSQNVHPLDEWRWGIHD